MLLNGQIFWGKTFQYFINLFTVLCYGVFQHVDEENSYLCGYLKIKGLTEEFPTLTTFFDGEIISKKYPFLTRKWDADEDVDKKHWVSWFSLSYKFGPVITFFFRTFVK